MKMTLQNAVEFARHDSLDLKKHMDTHGHNMPPTITFYAKEIDIPLMQIGIPTHYLEQGMKQIAYATALSVGAFIGIDYLTIANDTFFTKHDKTEENKNKVLKGDYVKPSEDINSQEAIMIIGMSKDGDILNILNEYSRDDVGAIYFKDSHTQHVNINDDDDDMPRSWMIDAGMMTFDAKYRFEDETGMMLDADKRAMLIETGMMLLAKQEYMVAFTEPIRDYIFNTIGEGLSEEKYSMLDTLFGLPTDEDFEE